MKTKKIDNLKKFSGTVLVPAFETSAKNLIPITFDDVEVSSKVFYGKIDTHYLAEKSDNTFIFIGLGKSIDYKSLKTIFRRIASKEKETFAKSVALSLPSEFSNEQVEATISGLLLGTYSLGHFKKQENHPFLNPDFELDILSSKDHAASINKAVNIARAQLETLSLVDLPPNRVTPKYLAKWALDKGKKYGFDVEVLGLDACKIEGLGAFLAVGKGSENEPQFVIMKYSPKEGTAALKHVGLVGKGITFDPGGLNY